MAYQIYNPVEAVGRTDADAPEPGAKLWFRLYNTTTPKAVYQDPNGASPHTNPVLANANGQWPAIYWDNTIRTRVLKTGPAALNPNSPDWQVDDIGALGYVPDEDALHTNLDNLDDLTEEEAEAARNKLGVRNRELNVLDYGAVGDGTTDDTVAIQAVINEAEDDGWDVLIPRPCFIDSALTIPPFVTVSFVGDGMLKPDSGVTITFNGLVNAPAKQIFDISLGGVVNFGGNEDIPALYFDWWGPPERPDGDAQPMLQAAVDSVPSRCPIYCAAAKRYSLGSSVIIESTASRSVIIKSLRGTGLGGELEGTYFWWEGPDNGVMFDCRSSRSMILEGLVFLYSDGVTVGANNAVKMSTPVPADGITSANIIRDCAAYGFSANASLRVFSLEGTGGSNGEFLIFERVGAYHFTSEVAGSRTGAGFYNEETSSNAHGHILRDCRSQGFEAGIKGSMGIKLEGLTGFNANDIDIWAVQVPMPLIIENCNSENGQQFFYSDSATGAPVAFRNNRIENATPSGMAIIEFLAVDHFISQGNKMLEPSGAGTGHFYKVTTGTVTSAILIGNAYVNIGGTTPTVPFSGTVRQLIALGDLYGGVYAARVSQGSLATISQTIAGAKSLTAATGATVTWDGSPFIKVNGSPAIATISVDSAIAAQLSNTYASGAYYRGVVVWLYGDAAWTTVTGGNIGRAASFLAGMAVPFLYDQEAGSWYPR